MFDIFLIDNKISSYLRPKLGKEFHKARKWVMNLLESHILKPLKTNFALLQVADSYPVKEEEP